MVEMSVRRTSLSLVACVKTGIFANSRDLEVGEGGNGLECILQTNPPCLFWGASGVPARPYETQQHDPLLLDLLSAPTSSASDSSSPASSASSASAGFFLCLRYCLCFVLGYLWCFGPGK